LSYVSDIRAKIGHAPLQLTGASVIVRRGGAVLLMRRSDTGLWGYHGGGLELGETLEQAAGRELLEESGLTALRLRLFGVYAGPEQHVVYPNGDEVYYTDVLFECDAFEGEPMGSNEEVLEQRWFDLNDLPPEDQISPPIRPQMVDYCKFALSNT
jgi:8-oxo-dGTP pyrophosphatase MutT (NUDIX family)